MTLYRLFAVLTFALADLATATVATAATEVEFTICVKQRNFYQLQMRRSHVADGKFFYAYANGTGGYIAGINGCGWSARKNSAAEARASALGYCRKHNTTNNCKLTVEFRLNR